MGIIVKFIVKNIYEKKFRTFLILISITLSTALFFASSAIQGTVVKMYMDRMMQYFGKTDIIIHANEKSPSSFFNTVGLEGFSDRLDFAVGLVQGSASYKPSRSKTVSLEVMAVDYNDLQKVNPPLLYSSSALEPFEGNKIILSKNTADKYGLKEGGTIALDFRGRGAPLHLTIAALAEPSGLFLDESQSVYAVMPRETLASIYGARGRVNLITIKTKDPEQKQELIKELSEVYKRYTVREPFSEEELWQNASTMTIPFMLMTVIVMLISVFIIYTSFKVVTMERLPVIGTFRSIGATRKTTDAVLLLESVIYGLLGGVLGLILGLGILYVMSYFTRPVGVVGVQPTVSFSPWHMAAAFLAAVALSFASCILPILKISKIPVRDIVLNVMQKALKKGPVKLVAGTVLLAVAVILPNFAPDPLAMIVNSSCMVLSMVGVIMLVPYITAVFVKTFEKLYTFIFGNIGILAAKNLRDNKNILNNISLLTIGISSLLMINTISSSVVTEVANVYRSANFEVWMFYAEQADRNLERILRQVDGVAGTYGSYAVYNAELEGLDGRILYLQGIDPAKYRDYWDTDFVGDKDLMLSQLDRGRNIIISETLREKYRLKAGDTMTLRLRQTPRQYRVIGFMNTMMYNGSNALISEDNMKMDTGNRFYQEIFIKTSGDPQTVAEALDKQLVQRPHSLETLRQMEEENAKSNDNIFKILKGFSLMTLAIGTFGVLNNLMLSFIERRRSLAMLRSTGMSRRQTLTMVFIEALSGGLVGGMAGVGGGYLLIYVLPFFLKTINLSVPVHYHPEMIPVYLAAGILITVAASVSPALKSSRMNIIEAIKYE